MKTRIQTFVEWHEEDPDKPLAYLVSLHFRLFCQRGSRLTHDEEYAAKVSMKSVMENLKDRSEEGFLEVTSMPLPEIHFFVAMELIGMIKENSKA